MASFVDTFRLRTATKLDLSRALSYAYAEFMAVSGQASDVRRYREAAKEARVSVALERDAKRTIEFMVASGYIMEGQEDVFRAAASPAVIAKTVAERAEHAGRLAGAVLLHTGLERFLWSMCRIGSSADRARALHLIREKQIKVARLSEVSVDECLDEVIESWLSRVQRDTCLEKWEAFAALFGIPKDLIHPPEWHFTREAIEEFDAARHDAVHHSGTKLVKLDLDQFQTQLSRAVLVLIIHVCQLHQLNLFPQAFMGVAALDALPSATPSPEYE